MGLVSVLLPELKKIGRSEFWVWRRVVYSETHEVAVRICGLGDGVARTCVADKQFYRPVLNGMLRLRLASCY